MKVYPVIPRSRAELEGLGEAILKEYDERQLITPRALDVGKLIDSFLKKKYQWSLDIREDLPNDILGLSDPKGKKICLSEETYLNLLNGDGRCRFTGCHEFGHVTLHRDQMRVRMVAHSPDAEYRFRTERASLRAFEDPEWQADYFAGVLLMPRPMVLQLMKLHTGDNLINEMVGCFQVSRAAAEMRLKKMPR